MPLTKTQSFYLTLVDYARSQGKSLREAAEDHNVKPANLYAAAKTLRKLGALDGERDERKSGFVALKPEILPSEKVELKTQLPNGQPVWLNCAPSQLATVLQAIAQ